jgi:DNA repair exonuclease SbcCD ATPase subunit
MGNQVSSTNVLTIDVKSTLDVVYNTMISNKQETVQSIVATNSIEVLNGPGGVINGRIILEQKIDLNAETSGKLDSSIIQNMQSEVKSKLDAALEQSAKATAGWLSSGNADTLNYTKIKNAVEQSVTDVFRVENYNAVVQATVVANEGKVYNYGTINGDLIVKQGVVANIIARNIVSNIINRTNKILQDQNLNLRISQDADAKAEGETITGASKFASGIISLICCIIIISLLFVALSPAGQRGVNKVSNAGAARMGATTTSSKI